MKSFLALSVIFLSMQSQAATLAVECQGSDLVPMNKFSASGLIETNEAGEAKGVVNLTVLQAGHGRSSKDLGATEVTGQVTVYAAGSVAHNEMTSLALAAKNETAHMTLNLGLKSVVGSSLLLDGVLYKAECSLKN